MPVVRTEDGSEIFYKDWGGDAHPVVLSHGWPLNADAWDAAALFLANHGYRVIAHDRRGHGRSSQTWHGNEMDTYADDLAAIIDTLDQHDVTLVGHSTGGGEIVRYLRRHGTARVTRLVLVAAGPPADSVDSLRARELADRAQLYRELADGPFFGHHREGAVSQGIRDAFWLRAMACGHRAAYEGVAAFTAAEFHADLVAVDVPTLVVHGSDDQLVPVDIGERAAGLVDGAVLTIYEGGPHGLPDTDRDRLHADLLQFVNR